MDEKGLELWLKKILRTEEQEISCSECFDRISDYAEQDLVNAHPDPAVRQVAIHLEQCRACQEEYELLRDLVKLESSRGLPNTQDLLETIRYSR